MGRFALVAAAALVFWGVVAVACKVTTNPPPDGGGAHGAGGCPTGAVALYTVHVTASDGLVPPDTTLLVRWSVGEEPEFDLADPETWRSVEDGSNVECNVPPDAAPPVSLEELVCELWTSGATDVEVAADGYLTVEETLTPVHIDECEEPVPSTVDLELRRDPDAGL